MPQLTLLVDGDNLAGIAAGVALRGDGHATDTNGNATGNLKTFLLILRSAAAEVTYFMREPLVDVVVAWSCPRSECWRRDLFAGYKGSRDAREAAWTPEERARDLDNKRQLGQIKLLLPTLGVTQAEAPRFEADDIAGHFTRLMTARTFVLVSNDSDWLQLIGERTAVFQNQKRLLLYPENLPRETDWPSNPQEIIRLKALAGEKGDDVPGAEGVGLKKAKQFLEGTMPATHKAYQSAQAWMENPDGFERSRQLVDLRARPIPAADLRLTRGQQNLPRFISLCRNLGIAVNTSDQGPSIGSEQWLKPFLSLAPKKAASPASPAPASAAAP